MQQSSCLASTGLSGPIKRKRSPEDASPIRRVKPTAEETPSYPELGFDPFAPHPGMTKEERKLARMIRNRNAAQASRDRKKEHVVELENRVRELEAQLASLGRAPPPAASSSAPCATTVSMPPRSPSPTPSHASTSTISPSQAESLSQARIASLEEENERLRDRLDEEARRSEELKGRLEGVEKRFEGLEKLLSSFVGQSTPLPPPTSTFAPPSTDLVDWTTLLVPTPTLSALPAPRPLFPATSASGIAVNTEPILYPVTSQTTSNRLVAREVSLPRTLALTLTAQKDRALLLRRRPHHARNFMESTSRRSAWQALLVRRSTLTAKQVPYSKPLSRERCKKKDRGRYGGQKSQWVVRPTNHKG